MRRKTEPVVVLIQQTNVYIIAHHLLSNNGDLQDVTHSLAFRFLQVKPT